MSLTKEDLEFIKKYGLQNWYPKILKNKKENA